jgi:hypothetical protein
MHHYKSRHSFLLCFGQSEQIRRIWAIGGVISNRARTHFEPSSGVDPQVAVAVAARKLRLFIMLHPQLLSLAQQKQLPNI